MLAVSALFLLGDQPSLESNLRFVTDAATRALKCPLTHTFEGLIGESKYSVQESSARTTEAVFFAVREAARVEMWKASQ